MHERDNQARRRRQANRNSSAARDRRNGGSLGNARQKYESYLARAREAQLAGDIVEMENCYQHAEHYLRLLRGVDVGT
jgi:hypothetical protein